MIQVARKKNQIVKRKIGRPQIVMIPGKIEGPKKIEKKAKRKSVKT